MKYILTQVYPAVLVQPCNLMTLLCTSLMVMDQCTDLMDSWSWILTFPNLSVVLQTDLYLQPARTTVLGVSYLLLVLSNFVLFTNINRQTECFSSLRKYVTRHQNIVAPPITYEIIRPPPPGGPYILVNVNNL